MSDWELEEDLADYRDRTHSGTWIGALLVMGAFIAGGLCFACAERWLTS